MNPSALKQNQKNRRRRHRVNGKTTTIHLVASTTTGGEWVAPPTHIRVKRHKRYNMSNDHWKQLSKLIPDYGRVSLPRFRDLILDLIASHDHQKIKHWLSDSMLIQFVHRQAALTCAVRQLQIEQSYWQHVVQLDMPTMKWTTEFSKALTKRNSIKWDHTKTKANIEHRQNIISTHLQRATSALNDHLQQTYVYALINGIEDHTSLSETMHILSDAIMILVQRSLSYFRTNFEQKMLLLSYDLQAAHLVKSFYDLNPTEEQVSIYLLLCHF